MGGGGTDTADATTTVGTDETAPSDTTKTATATSSGQAEEESTIDSPAASENRTATVTEIVNGDTLTVEFMDADDTTNISLIGVDAPAMEHEVVNLSEYDYPESNDGSLLAEQGHKAMRLGQIQLRGEEVTVSVVDEQGADGTPRAYVYYGEDNSSYNQYLLTKGVARATNSTHPMVDRYQHLEDNARTNGVGIWSNIDTE